MDDLLSNRQRELRARFHAVAQEALLPYTETVDAQAQWPAQGMRALSEARLMGLQVPARCGGLGQGLLGLAVATETLAQACPSTAMCYGMHCVGSAVIAAKATPYQEEHYLRPIAQGRHVTSLALSESGSGVHIYLPQTALHRADDGYTLDGIKQFVTNGGHADSYVVSTVASGADTGEFSCLIVDANAPGLSWMEPWQGFGMRGNSSRGMRLERAKLPLDNLLGEEGDQVWYVFEVVAPFFLMAMAGTYLGIAQAALDIAVAHVRARRYAHSGTSAADSEIVQHKIAQIWTSVAKTRALIYSAAHLGDAGDPQALPALLAAKADVAETAVEVTNEAMTLCGGIAYRENAQLSRLLRDARAAHVMAPTTYILRTWLGRSLLGLPLL